jgi:hypothetical protein
MYVGCALNAPDEVEVKGEFPEKLRLALQTYATGLRNADIIPEHMSPVYFPPVLLKQLGIEMPEHIRYLSGGIEQYPVIHRQFLWTRDGDLVDFMPEMDNHPFLRGLQLMQYDVLFGEGYSLSEPERAPAAL